MAISFATLPNAHTVLGAMAQPDLIPSQISGASASLDSSNQTPDANTIIHFALSPYSTTYFPTLVAYTRFIMLIMLYGVSFVLACMLASTVNRPLKPTCMLHHRRAH